jgi:hypothetical protein
MPYSIFITPTATEDIAVAIEYYNQAKHSFVQISLFFDDLHIPGGETQ